MKKLDDLLMSMLKNKEDVLVALHKSITEASKIEGGLESAADRLADNPSKENVAKFLNTTMKCTKSMARIIKMLAMVNIVYAFGNNYSSDLAKMLTGMGKGKEALRELFEQKLKGKF